MQDHPRSCGEYIHQSAFIAVWKGSSPLMRGIHYIELNGECEIRIIPAHAGNTFTILEAEKLCKDHPRSCGEYYIADLIVSITCGSSPLMRGIRPRSLFPEQSARIIPAHAGNTLKNPFIYRFYLFKYITISLTRYRSHRLLDNHLKLCEEYD